MNDVVLLKERDIHNCSRNADYDRSTSETLRRRRLLQFALMTGHVSLRDLSRRIEGFCDERDWAQFHNTKDLAISLALEASEVLEITQWKDEAELESDGARARMGEELSDVLYWPLLLCARHNIDLASAFEEKMVQNEAKYPVSQAHGSAAKYTHL